VGAIYTTFRLLELEGIKEARNERSRHGARRISCSKMKHVQEGRRWGIARKKLRLEGRKSEPRKHAVVEPRSDSRIPYATLTAVRINGYMALKDKKTTGINIHTVMTITMELCQRL
jgi:hypothetical protein